MTTSKTNDALSIWLPVGLVLGVSAGVWLDDVTTGIALGLLIASTAGALGSYKKKELSAIWPALGAIAFTWVLVLTIVHRV